MLEKVWRKGMLLPPIGGNVNWRSHHGEQYGGLLKLKIELPHDLEIPLLGIYPEETILRKDTYRAMFRSALFRIVKASKQPKCLSTIEGINKMPVAYTHTCAHAQWNTAAATTAKSLQSCPTLCDPIPGILQARTLEWVAIYNGILLSHKRE